MLFLVTCSFFKNRSDLIIAFFFSDTSIISVFISRFRLTCESGMQTVFLMQSRGDYSAAGAKKEICVAPVMASADSIVMGAVSTLSVAKEPS